MKDNCLTLHPHYMEICILMNKKYYLDASQTKKAMIVSMAMIASAASYTKNHKIELYIHFKKTR